MMRKLRKRVVDVLRYLLTQVMAVATTGRNTEAAHVRDREGVAREVAVVTRRRNAEVAQEAPIVKTVKSAQVTIRKAITSLKKLYRKSLNESEKRREMNTKVFRGLLLFSSDIKLHCLMSNHFFYILSFFRNCKEVSTKSTSYCD